MLLIVAIYVSVCMNVCTQRPKNLRNQTHKKKPKPKPNRKKLTKKKTVAEIRVGNRRAQQIQQTKANESSWRRLKCSACACDLSTLQFCKASRRCDDRTRSGSCRACVRGRSALVTRCTNVAGVRRTIEGLAVVRWRPLQNQTIVYSYLVGCPINFIILLFYF